MDPIEEAVTQTLITESELHKESIFGDQEITQIEKAPEELSTHESTRIVSLEELERLSGEKIVKEEQPDDHVEENDLPFETTVVETK